MDFSLLASAFVAVWATVYASAWGSYMCPPGWEYNPYHVSCLKPMADNVTWYDARDACGTLSSTLVLVDSELMLHLLLDISGNLTHSQTWTASNDIMAEADLRGVSNAQMVYTNWENGQPDGLEAQNCVMQNLQATSLFQDDKSCESDTYEYVCEQWIEDAHESVFTRQAISPANPTITKLGLSRDNHVYTVRYLSDCGSLCMTSRYVCDAFIFTSPESCQFLQLYEPDHNASLSPAELIDMLTPQSVLYVMVG